MKKDYKAKFVEAKELDNWMPAHAITEFTADEELTSTTASSATWLGSDINEDYKLDRKNRVLCSKCGHKKFIILPGGYILTSYPGIQVSFYECAKCGHKFSVSRQVELAKNKASMVYK